MHWPCSRTWLRGSTAYQMSPEVVYICSDFRSGSTLLDQLLGSHHSIASVGEIYHLNAYVLRDRTQYDPAHELLCNCGLPVSECEFWLDVQARAGRPLDTFQIDPYTPEQACIHKSGFRRRQLLTSLVEWVPRLYQFGPIRGLSGGRRLGRDSLLLFDAIAEVSGKNIIVDSSKYPFRFLSLYYERPSRTKLILLTRDYRGVVHSKMKRGASLEQSILGWVRRMRQMDRVRRLLPESRMAVVKYEDLCADPEHEMAKLCKFVGVDFSRQVLRRSPSQQHHIGGSPSKFNEDKRAIRLDDTYLTAFSAVDVERMRHIAADEARNWGYR